MRSVFIRGSVVRYVHMKKTDLDVDLLLDSTRLAHKLAKEAPL